MSAVNWFATVSLVAAASGAAIVGPTPVARDDAHLVGLMSPAEFDASGLRTLTPDQLHALDRWLRAYVATTIAKSQGVEQTIESRIDGDFDGWDGATIFTLENGQVWQQSEPGAKYHFASRPKVTVSSSSYVLKVDGMAAAVRIRRIK